MLFEYKSCGQFMPHRFSASNTQWKDETPKHENVKQKNKNTTLSEMLYGIDYVSYIFVYTSASHVHRADCLSEDLFMYKRLVKIQLKQRV